MASVPRTLADKALTQLMIAFLNAAPEPAINWFQEYARIFHSADEKNIRRMIEQKYDLHLGRPKPPTVPTPIVPIWSDDLEQQLQMAYLNCQQKFINKILLVGPPGTGKTIFAQTLAQKLNYQLIIINYSEIIDSKLGQTMKNLNEIFKLHNGAQNIIFFDELDGLSTDRTNQSDITEMARVTTVFLKWLEKLDNQTIFIAATNLVHSVDAALKRRLDLVIDFDCYQNTDLLKLVDYYQNYFTLTAKQVQPIRNIITTSTTKFYPFEIANVCKSIKMHINANLEYQPVYKQFANQKICKNERF